MSIGQVLSVLAADGGLGELGGGGPVWPGHGGDLWGFPGRCHHSPVPMLEGITPQTGILERPWVLL